MTLPINLSFVFNINYPSGTILLLELLDSANVAKKSFVTNFSGNAYTYTWITDDVGLSTGNYKVRATFQNGTCVGTSINSNNFTITTNGALQKVSVYDFPLESAYNTSYNPNTKFGTFTVNNSILVYDPGSEAIGSRFSTSFIPTNSGFSHSTLRSYGITGGQNAANTAAWLALNKSKKAFEQNADADVFVTSESGETRPNWYSDAGCISGCGTGCDSNPFVNEDAALNTLITQFVEADIVSFDTEYFWTLPPDSHILGKRNCFENGKYKLAINGGTDPYYSLISDIDFVTEYKLAWVDYWKRYIGLLKAKCVGNKMAWYGTGSKLGAAHLQSYPDTIMFDGQSHWWWTHPGNSTSLIKQSLDYQGGFDTYIAEYSSPIDPSSTVHITNLLSVVESLRFTDGNTKRLVHFKPFRENVIGQESGNCTDCQFASASKQVAQSMIYSLFFTGSHGWLWGTTFKVEFNPALDYVMEARKVCSDLNFLITGTEQFIVPEISINNGASWIGDATNWSNSMNPTNPNKYNAHTILNSNGNIPIVRAITNGNNFAIFATTSGTTTTQDILFRIPKTTGGYFQSALTVTNKAEVYKGLNLI